MVLIVKIFKPLLLLGFLAERDLPIGSLYLFLSVYVGLRGSAANQISFCNLTERKLSMLEYLTKGTLLGLAAGLAPGPLLVLVISETIRHNKVAGIKVAFAPMLTDMPIILLALLVLPRLPHFKIILGVISIIGAVFISYLAYESFKTRGVDFDPAQVKPQSLKKGFITNLLNPHPYVFWLGVGVPIIYKALQSGATNAVVFIGTFFVCIVGSKIGLALIVNKYRTFLSGSIYVFMVRGLGLILAVFAIMLIRDGVRFFNTGW